MKPDEIREEIVRLERLRVGLAPRVMGGDAEALAEDERLHRRIRELARLDREARSDQLRESWRRNHPGGTA